MAISKKIRKLRDPLFGYVLIAPIFIWICVTLFYPLVRAIFTSFMNIEYLGEEGVFVGFANYVRLVNDVEFRGCFLRTLIWTAANVFFQILVAFLASLILDMEFKGKKFLRIWILASWIIPVIVLATIWSWMLVPSFGIVNYVLKLAHLIKTPIPFLGSTDYAMISAILVNTWRWFPFYAVMILAGLQIIPSMLYEAAKIDGATTFQQFRYVTLPSIMPILVTVVLICSLWAANVFDMIWLLTMGGPSNSTQTLPIFIYEKGFQEYKLSQAAAAAVFMFIFLLIYGIIYLRNIEIEKE
jgi:multiple sugar transport system permease protein